MKQKVKINYPCQWSYRIIGDDEDLLRAAADSVIGDKECKISVSNRSSGGKYCALRIELIVDDEHERLQIFHDLRQKKSVRYVL